MPPSALEARGYTLPTAIPCMSKHPENPAQMKPCTSQACSCFPVQWFLQHQGRVPGRLCGAGHTREPHSMDTLAPVQCQRLLDQQKVPSPHVPTGQMNQTWSEVSLTRQSRLNRKQLRWFVGALRSWWPPPRTNGFQGARTGCALRLLQPRGPPLAGPSVTAAPSCVHLLPPRS